MISKISPDHHPFIGYKIYRLFENTINSVYKKNHFTNHVNEFIASMRSYRLDLKVVYDRTDLKYCMIFYS